MFIIFKWSLLETYRKFDSNSKILYLYLEKSPSVLWILAHCVDWIFTNSIYLFRDYFHSYYPANINIYVHVLSFRLRVWHYNVFDHDYIYLLFLFLYITCYPIHVYVVFSVALKEHTFLVWSDSWIKMFVQNICHFYKCYAKYKTLKKQIFKKIIPLISPWHM